MNPADQYRAELAACPERLRVYVMGLEAAVNKLERLQNYDLKLQEAIIAAHVSGLPDNWEFQDPMTTVATLARQCSLFRDSEIKWSRTAFDWERRWNHILGYEIEARRAKQDAKYGGPEHDDSHDLLDLTQYMKKFLARAEDDLIGMGGRIQSQSAENHLIDVVALGVATIQSARRKRAAAFEPKEHA